MRTQFIAAFLLGISAWQNCIACDLQCENGRLFEEYEREDKKLNSAYYQLFTLLSADERNSLRTTQRKWIGQRDSVCAKKEEEWCAESGCTNGLQLNSAANAGLTCMVEVTTKRTKELEVAKKNKGRGAKPDFSFVLPNEKG